MRQRTRKISIELKETPEGDFYYHDSDNSPKGVEIHGTGLLYNTNEASVHQLIVSIPKRKGNKK